MTMFQLSKLRPVGECIDEAREIILAAKPMFNAARPMFDLQPPEEKPGLARILMGNFDYLTRHGVLTQADYIALFMKCLAENDFYELGMLFEESYKRITEQYLADHPDLPEKGNVFYPGKLNYAAGIARTEGAIEFLEEIRSNGEKLEMEWIGGPAFDDTPDWLVALRQMNIPIEEVYERFAGKREQMTSSSPQIEERITADTNGAKRSVRTLLQGRGIADSQVKCATSSD